jgi:hypothetical protein
MDLSLYEGTFRRARNIANPTDKIKGALSPRDEPGAEAQQSDTRQASQCYRMFGHAQPAEVIDHERHGQLARQRKS